MKRKYYTIVALLIVGHLLTELHTFIYWANTATQFYFVDNWFIQSWFKVDKLNILWYSKMIEDTLLLAVLLYTGASQAHSRTYSSYLEWQRYSMRLYIIWCIYFAYHGFDLLSFFYNYKTSYWLYIIVLSVSTSLSLFTAFFKIKK